MIMIMRGCFTLDYLKAFMAAPEDREAAMHRLVEASGSKLLGFYFTAGEKDFMMIAETDTPEKITATTLAVASTGMITNTTTLRAFTCAEFKEIGEMAGNILSAYRLPGQQRA